MAKKCYHCRTALRQENEAGELCSSCRKKFITAYIGVVEDGNIQLLFGERDKKLEETFDELIPIEVEGKDLAELSELADLLGNKLQDQFLSGSGILSLTIPNIIWKGLKKAGKLK